jgi:hypothetical protein
LGIAAGSAFAVLGITNFMNWKKGGLIITPNKSGHDILIGLFQPVTEMFESLRQIKNKVDDQKKSCKSRIR